ncbi:fasciclin domain-containing protein [Pseudonocardia broussonetiae]|uniref:Fasciclin domain-containing protein n=1 Tax=Pseudonocardia broussonetiae TaxID=2736640 RepID=A0A6M6JEE1_9PSEU|nr:fasciclin domain-containing protein [Pseudonocardia broussonetiae]QJY46308.1 fasciclin domain-containing protein [Pseudonocardia broussonetiae]
MRKIQRLAAVGAMAALTVALGACSSSETPSAQAPASSAPSAAATTEAAAASDGVTTIDDIFGPACNQVPTEGEGSAQGMIDDPVATAASNNPLLSTLVTAVGAVPGLADTLNAAPALTVFAPYNGAFEALPAGTVETLVANPDQLAPILQGHVSSTRYDAAGLVDAGSVDVLSGGTVTIGGTAEAPTFDGGNGTAATNLCGNVPTSNATVFVIDTILMPAS